MLTTAAVLGGAAVGSNLLTGYLNYENQKDTLNWQKDTQRDIFAREDTSIARRVADLKASGLSPVLAAGQGAGTGGTVSVTPPQLNLGDNAVMALNLMQQEANIAKTEAEKEYIELQKSKIPAEIKAMNTNTWLTGEKARAERVNANVVESSGVPGKSIVGSTVNDFMGSLKKLVKVYQTFTMMQNVKLILNLKVVLKYLINHINRLIKLVMKVDIKKEVTL